MEANMNLEANGVSMAYTDTGVGLPVLFIHGFPLNRQMWAPQISALASAARLLVPDLRGHGDTPPSPGDYTMELLAQDLNAFLEALDFTARVVVCGLSMGGYVALAFYRQYAARVRGLVLTATRAAADTPQVKAGRDAMALQAQQAGVAAIVESMAPKLLAPQNAASKPELVAQVKQIMIHTSLEGILGALSGMKTRSDSTLTLGAITVPTLVVHGADDQIVPLDEARAMAQAIPGARLEIIPGAGHLINLEQPERFNRAFVDFLNGLPEED
jgi:pimeloyl-ACP methyl ester carboxylesterase